MKVIYINYNNFESNLNSASVVRPKAIFDTMIQMKYDVTMLTGELNKNDAKNRKKTIKEFEAKIKGEKYDFCYIESITKSFYKLYNKCDVRVIRKIAKMGVPIGVFYRDMYWKFQKISGIKGVVYYLLQKWELRFYKKYCKKIFVPSKTMGDFLHSSKTQPLPPACFDVDNAKDSGHRNIASIYVGAINKNLGTDLLLESFLKVNECMSIDLKLVCRVDERSIIEEFLKKHGEQSWLEVITASSNELAKVYAKVDFAIIPRRKDVYVDFAIPVKLFEYMSYQKPVVATNCFETAQIITKNNLGIVCEDNVESLSKAIITMSKQFCEFETQNFCESNQWKSRIETITEELLK